MSEPCCVRWFSYPPAEDAPRVEAFTVFGLKRDTDGYLFLPETLPKAVVTSLSDVYFRYLDTVSAVARHCGEVPSPQTSDPGVSTAAPDYYVNVVTEAVWDLVR